MKSKTISTLQWRYVIPFYPLKPATGIIALLYHNVLNKPVTSYLAISMIRQVT